MQRANAKEQVALTRLHVMQPIVFDSLVDRARRRAAKLGRVFRRDHGHDGGAFLTPTIDCASRGSDDGKAVRLNSDNGSFSRHHISPSVALTTLLESDFPTRQMNFSGVGDKLR